MGLLDKVQDKVQDTLNKRNPGNNPHATTHNTTTHTGTTHGQGMVPGSHANNPNAIPTAGGQTVGEPGYNSGMNTNTGYNNNSNIGGPGGNAGLHQTTGDKMQNALPGQHGNVHDAHGNSVDLAGPGHNNHGTTTGGLTGSGAHNTHTTHTTHNTHTGPDNRGMMDKAKDAMSSNRTNQPDDPITGTNYDQNNRNTRNNDPYSQTGSGITGSNTHHQTGPDFAGGNTHSNQGLHNQRGHNAGPDNRGMMDKAKDAMSSNRSNRPDDPVTGTNFDQNNRNTHVNDPYSQTGSGIAGSNTHHQTGTSGLHGNTAHHQTGAGFAGGNTHTTTHGVHDGQHAHNAGPDNRGMMDKAKDALSSKRSNHPDDPVTGTNYDQTSRPNQSSGLVGGNDPYHQTGSGMHSNTTHHQTGPGGVAGSNVHNTHGSHTNYGNDNRGMMDKAKDMLSSKRSNHPDDPVTGTNYDQTNAAGVHGQQHGVVGNNNGAYGNNAGAYNAPGSGPAPNY